MPGNENDLIRIMKEASDGSKVAMEQLLPLVYEQLRRMAAARMVQERADHTLQPTALVHEAFLKMIGQTDLEWQDRGHFFAVAATAMRRVLVDHARGKNRLKRGGGLTILSLDETSEVGNAQEDDILALDAALGKLDAEDPVKAKIVELRYFGGLTVIETAELLGLSVRATERHWEFARIWLFEQLRD